MTTNPMTQKRLEAIKVFLDQWDHAHAGAKSVKDFLDDDAPALAAAYERAVEALKEMLQCEDMLLRLKMEKPPAGRGIYKESVERHINATKAAARLLREY